MSKVIVITFGDYQTYGCPNKKCDYSHDEKIEALKKWWKEISEEDREFYRKFGVQMVCQGCGRFFLLAMDAGRPPRLKFAYSTGKIYTSRLRDHPKMNFWREFAAEEFLE